jgi:hypothetical protein
MIAHTKYILLFFSLFCTTNIAPSTHGSVNPYANDQIPVEKYEANFLETLHQGHITVEWLDSHAAQLIADGMHNSNELTAVQNILGRVYSSVPATPFQPAAPIAPQPYAPTQAPTPIRIPSLTAANANVFRLIGMLEDMIAKNQITIEQIVTRLVQSRQLDQTQEIVDEIEASETVLFSRGMHGV